MILFFVFFVYYFLKGSVLFHEWFFFFVCECVFYLKVLLWQLLKVTPVKLLMRGVCSVGAEWTILDKISWMTWLRSWIEWCLMARFWGYEVWIPSIMAEHLLNLDFQVSDVLRGPVDQLIFHTLEISVPPKKKVLQNDDTLKTLIAWDEENSWPPMICHNLCTGHSEFLVAFIFIFNIFLFLKFESEVETTRPKEIVCVFSSFLSNLSLFLLWFFSFFQVLVLSLFDLVNSISWTRETSHFSHFHFLYLFWNLKSF